MHLALSAHFYCFFLSSVMLCICEIVVASRSCAVHFNHCTSSERVAASAVVMDQSLDGRIQGEQSSICALDAALCQNSRDGTLKSLLQTAGLCGGSVHQKRVLKLLSWPVVLLVWTWNTHGGSMLRLMFSGTRDNFSASAL